MIGMLWIVAQLLGGPVAAQSRTESHWVLANSEVQDSSAPYSLSWNTSLAANGAHTLTAVARDAAGNTATSSPVSVIVNRPAYGSVTILCEPLGCQLSYLWDPTSTGNFKGLTWSPSLTFASTVWRSTVVPAGSYRIRLGKPGYRDWISDAFLVRAGEVLPPFTVRLSDSQSPTVSLTVPATGATVSGIVSVSASAADNAGVFGVQFKLDGADLGAEDSSAPYSVSWNTSLAANGAHTLAAVARDAAGNTATSSPVSVIVNRPAHGSVTVRSDPPGARIYYRLAGQARDTWNETQFRTPHTQAGVPAGSVQLRLALDGYEEWVSDTRPLAAGESQSFDATLRPERGDPTGQRTLVLLAAFQGNSRAGLTDGQGRVVSPARAEEIVFLAADSVAGYFRWVSYGRMDLLGEVRGWYEIPGRFPSDCDRSEIRRRVLSAVDPEVNFRNYSRVVIAFPRQQACSVDRSSAWSGWATQGSAPVATADGAVNLSFVWINGAFDLETLAHEMGHTLRLGHAGAFDCGPRGLANPACREVEYGDPFDIMSQHNTSPMNAVNREAAGWLRPGHIQVAAQSGAYQLEALEALDDGVKLLKVPRDYDPSGNVVSWYYLEFRRRDSGYETFPQARPADGVHVRITAASMVIRSGTLIDSMPETFSFNDAPLTRPGASISDPDRGASITLTRLESNRATVEIRAPGRDNTPPVIVGGPSVLNLRGTIGGVQARVSWRTDDPSVSIVRFERAGTEQGPRTAASGSLVREHSATLEGLEPATPYRYEVLSINSAGLSARSEWRHFRTGDGLREGPADAGGGGGPKEEAGEAVSLEGELALMVADDFEQKRSTITYLLRAAGKEFELKLPPRWEGNKDLRSGARLRVRGRRQGKQVQVEDSPQPELHQQQVAGMDSAEGSLEGLEIISAAPAPAASAMRIAVLLVNFADQPALRPWTLADADALAFGRPDSVAAYYREVSYGSFGLSGQVFGWYTLPAPSDPNVCNHSEIQNAALRAANADVHFPDYDGVVIAFPNRAACSSWAGLGSIGKWNLETPDGPVRAGIAWLNGYYTLRVFGHELGHNLGLRHANAYDCDSAPISASCLSQEYGDPFDIMGASGATWHLSAYQKHTLGWLGTAQMTEAQTSGIYALAPLETPAPANQALRIPRLRAADGTVSSWYYLEYRQAFGFDRFDPGSTVANGVSIRIAPDLINGGNSHLIDTESRHIHNEQRKGEEIVSHTFQNAALRPDRVFEDPYSGIRIITIATSPAQAFVGVQLGPRDGSPPRVSVHSPSPNQAVTEAVRIQASAMDNVAVSSMAVFLDASSIPLTRVLAGSLDFTWDTRGVPGGAHTLTVRAWDVSGNGSESRIPVSVNQHAYGSVTILCEPLGCQLSYLWDPSSTGNFSGLTWSLPLTFSNTVWRTTVAPPGSYRIRLGKPGYRDWFSEPFLVRAGEVLPPFSVRLVDIQSPQVRIQNLANGATIAAPVELQVAASDNGTLLRVELHLDSSTLVVLSSAPFRFWWDPGRASPGWHELSARAIDSAGNEARNAVRVFVAHPDNTPPRIFDVSVSCITSFGAIVAWLTDEPGDSTVEFEPGYSSPGKPVWDPNPVTRHRVALEVLMPQSKYRLSLRSRDRAGNLAVSGPVEFATLAVPTVTKALDRLGGTVTDDQQTGATVSVPGAALPEPLVVTISREPEGEQAGQQQRREAQRRQGLEDAGEAVEFGPGGTRFEIPVTIQLRYRQAKRLVGLFYWDASLAAWTEVTPSHAQGDLITAEVDHFSLYKPMARMAPAADSAPDVYVYPVPFRPNGSLAGTGAGRSGTTAKGLTFGNLPAASTVEVYTVRGELVWRGEAGSGTLSWNGRSLSGDPATSGIYVYLVRAGNLKAIGKLAIVR